MTRGIKHRVDKFVSEMSAQYFPFQFQGKEQLVQLAMRPVQLWEVVFPKEQLKTVLKTMGVDNDNPLSRKFGFTALRKALGAKKIPYSLDELNKDMTVPMRPVDKNVVACYGIGIKEDKENEEGEVL